MNFWENAKKIIAGGEERLRAEKRKTPVSSPHEEILLKNKAETRSSISGGITGAEFIQLRDDGAGVFKAHRDMGDGMYYSNRERAAYLIDRFLGFNFVPPTVVRKIAGETGSFQEFISDAKCADEVPEDSIPHEEQMKLNLFDSIISNRDRHSGNYLIKEGKIYAIDNGFSLDEGGVSSSYLRPCLEETALPSSVYEGLKRFSQWEEGKKLLRELLLELLDKKTVNGYMKRIAAVVTAIDADGCISQQKFEEALTSDDKKSFA